MLFAFSAPDLHKVDKDEGKEEDISVPDFVPLLKSMVNVAADEAVAPYNISRNRVSIRD